MRRADNEILKNEQIFHLFKEYSLQYENSMNVLQNFGFDS